MTLHEEQQIRRLLLDKMNEVLDDPLIEQLGCVYGDNHPVRMADAALAVLAATKECQELMKREGIE